MFLPLRKFNADALLTFVAGEGNISRLLACSSRAASLLPSRPAPLRREFSRHPPMVPTPETCPLDPRSKIKILNPAKPGLAMIGVKHALRYVRRGEAEFVQSGSLLGLRFTDDRERFRMTLAAASASGYDRAGMRTVAEIKRLPVAGNVVLGITRQTKRSAPGQNSAPPVEHNRPGRYAQVAGRSVKADGWWCRCQPTPPPN